MHLDHLPSRQSWSHHSQQARKSNCRKIHYLCSQKVYDITIGIKAEGNLRNALVSPWNAPAVFHSHLDQRQCKRRWSSKEKWPIYIKIANNLLPNNAIAMTMAHRIFQSWKCNRWFPKMFAGPIVRNLKRLQTAHTRTPGKSYLSYQH